MSADQKKVTNKRIRLIADVAMTILLPMLMAYSLIGEMFHEVISNYENDRIDIKSSVIAELAEALQTDPNYLILGEKASGADNRFVNEAAELFSKITDPKMQEMLLKQIRALV